MKDITDDELAEIEQAALLTQRTTLMELMSVIILGAVIMAVAYGYYLNTKDHARPPINCNPSATVCAHPASATPHR